MGKIRHYMAGISVRGCEKTQTGTYTFAKTYSKDDIDEFAFVGVPICVLGCPRVRSVSVGPHDIEDGEDQENYTYHSAK